MWTNSNGKNREFKQIINQNRKNGEPKKLQLVSCICDNDIGS